MMTNYQTHFSATVELQIMIKAIDFILADSYYILLTSGGIPITIFGDHHKKYLRVINIT